MKGRRIYPDKTPTGYGLSLAPGDYGRDDRNGHWMACTPNGLAGDLSEHEVVEHEDRTITVSPSILVTFDNPDLPKSWHGYLKRGVWKEV